MKKEQKSRRKQEIKTDGNVMKLKGKGDGGGGGDER